MPPQQWGDEICGGEDVQAAGQSDTCDAVRGGEDPGYLGLVNAEMRGDRAVETLLGEE